LGAWAVKLALPALHPILRAVFVLGPYGLIFLGITLLLRIPEAATALSRLPIRKR